MTVAYPQGTKVRFTQERLSVLSPRDRQGLAGRVGVIQTDCKLVTKPTVYFPPDGVRAELRLFRVDPRQLELVERVLEPAGEPVVEAFAENVVPNQVTDNNETVADVSENMSQEDLDKMFD